MTSCSLQAQRASRLFEIAGTSTTPFVTLRRYGILGAQLTPQRDLRRLAAKPGRQTAILDVATCELFQQDTVAATGVDMITYEWLGLKARSFPEVVRLAMRTSLSAKLHAYGEKRCIHAAGPDFNVLSSSRGEAVTMLARGYRNVLREGLAEATSNANPHLPPLQRLRLVPLGAGPYVGPFGYKFPAMTAEALLAAFRMLTAADRSALIAGRLHLDMCVLSEIEFPRFESAFADAGLSLD